MNKIYAKQVLHLSLNIGHYRKVKGLTQEELAERVGISRQHLGKIEAPNMMIVPSMERLFEIADVLEVTPAKLLEIRE